MYSEAQTTLQTNGENSREPMPKDEREKHEKFMREALAMAEHALKTNETPVGCVLVHNNSIISRGMNATNRTLNGTRHAEFIAVNEVLSPAFDLSHKPKTSSPSASNQSSQTNQTSPPNQTSLPSQAQAASFNEGIGKEKPSFKDRMDLLQSSDLYVTVEPCIMCASFLRQLGIRKVYFGAVNDRFGGTGGVLNIHNMAYPGCSSSKRDENEDGEGRIKGEANAGYEVSGGWLREEAIMLLRRFYVQENEKAPEPQNKGERVLKTEIAPMSII